ncbi:MAG TPA: acyl-CoA reductase [Candidatus Eremiobacteraceae bacterium]|nr:acyl-CoA reductase [Candidatus Eremiobacteraceae bacterium]
MRDSEWSSAVVEAALGDVLFDLDDERSQTLAVERPREDERPVLVILPGNIIGPAIASAYCAAAAGANVILKSPGSERKIAPIIAEQFDTLGKPLAGTIDARYWKGGDFEIEPALFQSVRKIIAFGSDEALDQIERRAPVPLRGYGTSYSVGFVSADTDLASAASCAARDVAMFDQRGCMSPRTIYVEGDEGRSLLFARALEAEMRNVRQTLPRGRIAHDEAAAIAMSIRKLSVNALAPKTHGLDTLIVGPDEGGVPGFVIVVEPDGPPTTEGFSRIVSVKPCGNIDTIVAIAMTATIKLESLGVCGVVTSAQRERLLAAGFLRVCRLGEMQRPPFGYRPTVEDFR